MEISKSNPTRPGRMHLKLHLDSLKSAIKASRFHTFCVITVFSTYNLCLLSSLILNSFLGVAHLIPELSDRDAEIIFSDSSHGVLYAAYILIAFIALGTQILIEARSYRQSKQSLTCHELERT